MTPEKQDALEAEQTENIRSTRAVIRSLVDDIETRLRTVDRLARSLGDGPGNLYDVEFTESTNETTCLDAIRTATICTAAIKHTVREIP